MTYTLPSEKYHIPDLSECRAHTHKIVALCPPKGFEKKDELSPGDGPASLWERPISHVFLLALQRIHGYFALQNEIEATLKETTGFSGDIPKVTVTFSLSQSSSGCLEGFTKDRAFTQADLEDVLNDIHLAHTCLSAARASKFILSLLRWPGVDLAIRNAGGWKTIESLGNLLTENNLDQDFPDEAHFALLGSIDKLIDLLESNKKEIINAARASQQVLLDMWHHFKRGKSCKQSFSCDAL